MRNNIACLIGRRGWWRLRHNTGKVKKCRQQIGEMPGAGELAWEARREADGQTRESAAMAVARAAEREPPPWRIPTRAASPFAEKLLLGTRCLPGLGPIRRSPLALRGR